MNKKTQTIPNRARSFHDSFVWMVHAAITWPTVWRIAPILRYWFRVAFDRDPERRDLDDKTFDRIRFRLLTKGGFVGAGGVLNTGIVQRINNQLTFIDERGTDEQETKVRDTHPAKTRPRIEGKKAKRFRRT